MTRAAWLLLALTLPTTARAWTDEARGVRYERRVVTLADRATATLHIVSVDLCDPTISIRATAPDEGGQRTSVWARHVGAVVAVNGDYFDERTRTPLGPARGAGHWWSDARREHRDALALFDRVHGVRVLDAPVPGPLARWDDARVRAGDAPDVVAVREHVLVEGRVRLNPRLPHDGRRHPRTALGLSADGHTLFLLVVDGRTRESVGLTTRELALRLVDVGAREGLKLDGGGSATMFIARRGVVNRPSDGVERLVANQVGVVVDGAESDRPRRAFCREPGRAESWTLPWGALVAPCACVVAVSERGRRKRGR